MPPENETPDGVFVAPRPEEIDALLPGYAVAELIAQGGMGAIYKGTQIKLDRTVAIKVLPKRHGADLDYAARFEQEAKAMARLSHNNIVGVYDYGETGDGTLLYFIMEYVEGSDLYTLLLGGEITSAKAISILEQICDALRYAHDNGIIHRDIKPANILIDSDGTVKMADFGLAKMQPAGGGVGTDHADEAAFGTPDYVAPETLIEGVIVDKRADIYSLGILIYEVLTGEVPKGTYQLPSVLNPEIDRRFDDLVVKALAHDREDRFSDVREIRAILAEIGKTPRLRMAAPATRPAAVPARQVAPGSPSPPRTSSRTRGRPGSGEKSGTGPVLVACAVVLLACLGALFWFVLRDDGGPAPEPAFASAEPAGAATPDRGAEPMTDSHPPENSTIFGDVGQSLTHRDREQSSPPPPARGTGTGPDPLPPIAMTATPASTPGGGSGTAAAPEPGPPPPPSTSAALSPEMRARAGRLRMEGTIRERETLGAERADGIDDFVAVRARNLSWQALRANGDVVALGDGENGITDVKWMEGRAQYAKFVRKDGTIWNNKNQPLFPELITDAVQAVSGFAFGAVRLGDNTVKVWGKLFESPNTLVDPPGPLSPAIDISANQDFLVIVEESGRVVCLGKDGALKTREPENDGDRAVDVEAGVFTFIALTRSGRVFTWNGIRLDDAAPAPDALGPAIAIRANHATYAAQRPNGTWFAWGNNPRGIVDTINRLPPVPDIAFAGVGGDDEFGYVMWIEPVGSFVPPSPVDGRITEVLQKTRKRYAELAQGPFHDGLKMINEFYLPALERGAAEAETEGDAATARLIRDEIARAGKAVDAARDGDPPLLVEESAGAALVSPRLVTLRETYRKAVKKLEDARVVSARAVLNTCLSDLAALETEMERDLGAQEASKVRLFREKAEGIGIEELLAP